MSSRNPDPRLSLRRSQLLRECLAALPVYALVPAGEKEEIIAAASRFCAEKTAAVASFWRRT